MKKIKNLILSICALFLCGISFAQVSLNPVYTSERFQPSDKFHAGCENQIDVVFKLDHYDWNKVEVLKIIANGEKENNLTYTVENDKIIFSKLKSEWNWLDSVTFSVFFKVWETVETSDFSFEKWSYIVDSKWNMVDLEWSYSFAFSLVPECDPDIVAPSVELLFPSNKSGEYVALDSYFQFEIDDAGKWVNEDSIRIAINWSEYSLDSIEHVRDDKMLTVYPNFWMPFNTGFEVEISVSDKQSYWKPNTTMKIYEFQTSDELNLLNEIDPVEFRKLVNMDQYFKWTVDECELLADLYLNSDQTNWEILESINSRLDCSSLENVEKVGQVNVVENMENNDKNFLSVFAMLWRILFGSLALFMIFWRLKK